MTTQTTSPRATVTLTKAILRIDSWLDYVYRIFGYICGTLLLLLGLYITYQVIVRKTGIGPVLGNSELVGGWILAFAGTWAFSYSLRTGSHVRIDVLLPLFSRIHPYMRSTADWMALGSVGFFGLVTAFYSWRQVLVSYCTENRPEVSSSLLDRFVIGLLGDSKLDPGLGCKAALENTYLFGEFPPVLWLPQIIVAVGFTMLAFTAFQWMLSMLARGILEILHKRAGGDPSELARDEIAQEAASGV